MKHVKYTKEQLINAIKGSRSIRQSLIALGIASKGGNYQVIHRAIKKYNIDISHFTQQGWAKGKKIGSKRSLDAYTSNQCGIGSYRLKNRLLAENILTPICFSCNLTTWLNQPIPLELDHIDGNNQNNNLNNLRLLCPNCHALTPTYRRKKQFLQA